jgi:flagellin-like protein
MQLMEDNTMKRVSIRKDVMGVSPVIAVILMVAITVVLAGVLYVWVTGLSDLDEKKAPMVVFELRPWDDLNSSLGQDISILTHQSGDKIKYADMKILVSNDGGTFHMLDFNVENPNLNMTMVKGAEVSEVTHFEVSENIYFKEGSSNWNSDNDLYVRIVHTPSKSTLFDDLVDVT